MATPCISPPKHHNVISQTLPIRTTMSLSDGSFRNCSVRHVKGDSLSQCRFSYAMWCPVCEEQDTCKRLYRGSRRRSKSEGMETERSKEYYTKTTKKNSMNYYDQPSNISCKDQYIRRLSNNENRSCQTYSSFSSNVEWCYVSNSLSDYHESHNHIVEKPSNNVFRSCENHIEPNCVNYETWNCLNSSRAYNQKDNDSIPLNEQYYYEVEMLRSKLKKIKDNNDEIRSRHDVQKTPLLEVGTKRPRDDSPSIHTVSSARKVSSLSFSNFAQKSTPASSTSCLLSSGSVTSVSSDSVLNYSGCEDEDVNFGQDIGVEEDDGTFYDNTKPSVSFSNSPSHLMGSISLRDCDEVANAGSKTIHPALRASLFSHVPPYIRFFTHEKKGADLPPCVQKLLKWRLSTITPVVVRKTIINSNFKLVRKSNEWSGTWGKHMKSLCFKTLREYQKINHFPGTFQIGRKDRLWKNLFRLMGKFGKKEFGFIPRTYVLPQDTKLLRSAWEKNCGNERWIVKPPASARGTGIRVIHKWTQIPKKCPLVVQKYISDPYLINGNKFDLRLYVLVTSINPLRIYLYDNGLVRFASVKYSNEMNSLNDRYMHLTNYSINKLSSQYTQNGDATACQGHKWSLHALWTYLKKQQVNVSALKNHLDDLVIKTIICGESAISQLSHANLASRYCSYELFGVDVLLDENLKPWLLEVNISPSLHSTSPLDLAVKGPMVRDLMNIVGFQIPNKLSSQVQADLADTLGVDSNLCYDRRLYTTALSDHERLKQTTFQQYEARDDYLSSILQDLTSDDVRHLIQYEDELTQLGNFQKIFPTTETYSYHQFFDNPRYYNMLFDAWEVKQCKNRNTGIALLELLCQKECHLDTTQIPPKRTKVSMSLSENDLRRLEQDLLEETVEDDALSIVPDKIKNREKWTLMLACSTICRVGRSRSSRPGVITKPYPRSAYIARRCAKTSHVVS